LTPRTFQSGETDWRGRISRRGDAAVRVALYLAARNILCHMKRPSDLRDWGLAIAQRHGLRKATVAVARRLAVTLHAMWKTDSDFRWAA
jgi:transposase